MKCNICGNEEEKYFGEKKGIVYCRRCIGYLLSTATISHPLICAPIESGFHLDFPLSEEQIIVSNQIRDSFVAHKDVLLHAVTGAGKTELVYQTIDCALKRGLTVGFAIPRRDVVIELFPRIQEAFPNASICAVYGGHSEILTSDIILLTTHQLSRYDKYFDLLIIDELDAFPFHNNFVLAHFLTAACLGVKILMSATPPLEFIDEIKKKNGTILTLFKRYHGFPLIVPTICRSQIVIYVLFKSLWSFLKKKKPVFVFCPTIYDGQKLFFLVHLLFKNGQLVHSKSKNRSAAIKDFKEGKLSYLITTSILERGVTIKDLQVIIFKADHPLYTRSTIVQIAGRVGRKIGATTGEVILVCHETTNAIKEAIQEIQLYNRSSVESVSKN